VANSLRSPFNVAASAIVLAFALVAAGCSGRMARVQSPDCAGVDSWPTGSAFAKLKNAGVTDNERLDFTKTKTVLVASQPIGDGVFRQVHHVLFTEKSGRQIEVITVNDASNEECSISEVEAYVVTKPSDRPVAASVADSPR
jgi:hypothetical protein